MFNEIQNSSIIFKDIYKSYEKIEFRCITVDEHGTKNDIDCYFILNGEFIPSDDNIALALVSLIKRKFRNINMELIITQETYEGIKKFTQANINVIKIINNTKIDKLRENIILNFSGGIDSLAALYIMPNNTKLVAIDFGLGFEREENFFKNFNPYVLKTNVRKSLDADHNSWEFMGIGAILYSNYLNAGYHVFGTIMEASKENFLPNFRLPISVFNAPFCYCGLKEMRYINGLTEIGTSIIASYYDENKIANSLISLSNPGTEKRYRKETLMNIVAQKFNRNIKFTNSEPPKYYRAKFGNNIALDFLCLYVIKNAGLDIAQNTMSEIPDEAVRISTELDLKFYERLNCSCLNGTTLVNDKLRSDMIKKVMEAGVYPYTESDYDEYRQVANFLNKYHNFYKK